jgi:hypothetical protein
MQGNVCDEMQELRRMCDGRNHAGYREERKRKLNRRCLLGDSVGQDVVSAGALRTMFLWWLLCLLLGGWKKQRQSEKVAQPLKIGVQPPAFSTR